MSVLWPGTGRGRPPCPRAGASPPTRSWTSTSPSTPTSCACSPTPPPPALPSSRGSRPRLSQTCPARAPATARNQGVSTLDNIYIDIYFFMLYLKKTKTCLPSVRQLPELLRVRLGGAVLGGLRPAAGHQADLGPRQHLPPLPQRRQYRQHLLSRLPGARARVRGHVPRVSRTLPGHQRRQPDPHLPHHQWPELCVPLHSGRQTVRQHSAGGSMQYFDISRYNSCISGPQPWCATTTDSSGGERHVTS